MPGSTPRSRATNQRALELPRGAATIKKHEKKEQQQQQQQQLSHQEYNSDDDTTTKAACPGAPGAPAWLTDPNPGRGHITSASPSQRGQKPSGRFCNLREAEPAHVSGRGVKLETGDGGETRQRRSTRAVYGHKAAVSHSLSFAGCSCKERRVCVAAVPRVCVSILADLVAILPTKIPPKMSKFSTAGHEHPHNPPLHLSFPTMIGPLAAHL